MHHMAILRRRIPGTIASGLALVTITGFLGPFAWWLDLFSHFRVHYALIAALLLIVALALRQKKTAVLSVLLLAVNGAVVVPYLLRDHVPWAPAGFRSQADNRRTGVLSLKETESG